MEPSGFKEKIYLIMTNAEKFQEAVSDSIISGRRFKPAVFDLFHYSVQSKIWEAKVYAEYIAKFDGNNYRFSNEQSTTTFSSELNKDEITKYANLYADGFFISLMGAFDALSCEINLLFELIPITGNIDFLSVRNELKQKFNTSLTYKCVEKTCRSNWWNDLRKYRNASTHEAIIVSSLDTNYDPVHHTEEIKSIFLPDNPKQRPYKHINQKELISVVRDINTKGILLIESIYRQLNIDLQKSNKKIPLKYN